MSWDEGEYYDVSFSIEKCRRYHAKLRDFYQSIHSWVNVANVFAASGTFVAVLGTMPQAAAIFSAAVALLSLLDLVFATDQKARLHHELNGRFTDLAAKMETIEPTPKNLGIMKAERLKIEKDEPSEKRLVDIMAHNDTCRARGVPESRLVPLSRSQRTLGYVFTHRLGRLEKWRAEKDGA